jgi:cytochrome c551/c552
MAEEKEVRLFSNTFMAATFALVNFVMVLLFMWTVGAEYSAEWRRYQREYYDLFARKVEEPELRQRILSTPLEVKQVWNPTLQVTDRCMTCHMGVSNPQMADAPQPYKVHPDFTQHSFEQIGCTVCHEGQGMATTVHDAHVMHDLDGRFGPFDEQHIGWSRPMLPLRFVQASCNKCHNVMEAPVPGANHLNAGWQLVQEKGCKTCHYIVDSGAKQAPELSTVGTKFFNESGHSAAFHSMRFGYLHESLRCPQANMSHEAAEACKATLAPAAEAAQGTSLSAAELIDKYGCKTCHNFDAPVKGMGPSLYDIGTRQQADYIRESILEPDKVVVEGFPAGVMKATLGGMGFYTDVQKNPAIVESLVNHLSSLKGAVAQGEGQAVAAQAAATVMMPNFGLDDEQLHNMVTFLLGLQEQTVPWPQKSFAPTTEAARDGQTAAAGGPSLSGKSPEELIQVAGCNTCHKFDGPERLVGPSLWDIGARQDKVAIRESILDPDRTVVAGYPPGVMKATLLGTGFYQQISLEALEQLVDYLASLKGKAS